jgi:tetratricopeptide (TPR) repeat protein
MRVPEVGPLRYFASELQVVPRYLALVAWPARLSVDPDPRIAPLLSAPALLCAGLLAGIAAAILAVRRRLPTVAFLAAAFFLLLAPTSSFIPSADLMFEHRVYFPMAAAAALAALGLGALSGLGSRGRPRRHRLVFAGLVLALSGGYAFASRARTAVWSSNIRLWEDAVAKAPLNARAHYNLGVAYLMEDRARARTAFRRALELRPDHAPSLYNLGWLDQSAGRYDAARRAFESVLAVDPSFWRALHQLGNIDVAKGRLDDARARYRAALEIRPDYWPTLLSLATLEVQREDFRGARPLLQRLLELRPDLLEARYLLAYACIGERDLAAAEAELGRLASRDGKGAYSARIEDLRRRAAASPAR